MVGRVTAFAIPLWECNRGPDLFLGSQFIVHEMHVFKDPAPRSLTYFIKLNDQLQRPSIKDYYLKKSTDPIT